MRNETTGRYGRVSLLAVTAACAFALATVGTPAPAFAESSIELQARIDVAKSELSGLFLNVEQTNEELSKAEGELASIEQSVSQAEEKLSQIESELSEARNGLSTLMASDYRNGRVSLLSVVLNASSFEQLTSDIYYMSRISENRVDAINKVVGLKDQAEKEKNELSSHREEQAQKVGELEQKSRDAQEAASKMQEHIAALDAEIQAKLKEEWDAASQTVASRLAEFQRLQEEALANGGTEDSAPVGGLTARQRVTILAAARACIGTPYLLGGNSPGVAIDCSGLTSYAYACAGLAIPRTSGEQRAASKVKPISECWPGDIVFWHGHVAIYAGDGKIVHANYGGVEEATLFGSYLGGGNPFE